MYWIFDIGRWIVWRLYGMKYQIGFVGFMVLGSKSFNGSSVCGFVGKKCKFQLNLLSKMCFMSNGTDSVKNRIELKVVDVEFCLRRSEELRNGRVQLAIPLDCEELIEFCTENSVLNGNGSDGDREMTKGE
mmetsp:Transcript_2251/g.3964  ORF Transcript_2251/g.3964 Transcript_2251/m.3964 type:complete len:131 (-) Transcript_2251:614-1006(-)